MTQPQLQDKALAHAIAPAQSAHEAAARTARSTRTMRQAAHVEPVGDAPRRTCTKTVTNSGAAPRRSPRHAHEDTNNLGKISRPAPKVGRAMQLYQKTKGRPQSGGSRSAEKQHDVSITEGGSTACTGPGQAVEASPPAASPKMSAPSIFPTYLKGYAHARKH